MKKKFAGILMLSAIAMIACACTGNKNKEKNDLETPSHVQDSLENQIDDINQKQEEKFQEQETNNLDIICYYGCPNSKRVKRLNLKKQTA